MRDQGNSSDIRDRESVAHLSGQSTFVDDWPLPDTALFAAVVTSPIAKGLLRSIETDAAMKIPGVRHILTAQHIPGVNQIGDIMPDERLLADQELKFMGKPVALVLADTERAARAGAAQVTVLADALTPTFNVHDAYHNGELFGEERVFCKGDTAQGFAGAHWLVEGIVDCQAQEHLYFETQVALAIPLDGQRLKILSASQNPSSIQKFAAQVLGVPMNAIEVEVPRLGGAFGGKEEQAKPWALLAALGAYVSGRPVKLALNRQEDMAWTGKRHPYHARYRLGASKDGKLCAYEVTFLQDGGSVADLSTAILERTLFHATNAYALDNVRITAASCRTNHPSNTAFRGFGAPQAIMTLECALDHLAQAMGKPRWQVQADNLLAPGYQFSYGMTVATDALQQCWQRLWEGKHIPSRLQQIAEHNRRQPRQVKALALMPLCFGISFTATHLNQASVTVNIYTDGSVGVAMSAVDMGQGITEKIRVIVSRCLDVPASLVRIDYTNSSKTANMSPTAASVGADLSGMAAIQACDTLRRRLTAWCQRTLNVTYESVTMGNAPTSWQTLIQQAYLDRVDLVAHAYHATPDLYFDRTTESGHPFAYNVYGVSAVEVSLDRILGTAQIERVDVVYDLGQSLDLQTDKGQMEGGLVQGIGYATMESLLWDDQGHLLTINFATYKIPDLLSSPYIDVEFIASDSNPNGPFSAKAIGEPPFLLGLGAYAAIADAVRAVNPQARIPHELPFTPERILRALLND